MPFHCKLFLYKHPRSGITIVELVVVIAILGILLALLLPAIQSSRVKAMEAVCKNNLHQLNLAMGQFCQATHELPVPVAPGQIGGWKVAIMPYLEQGNFRNTIPAGASVTDAPKEIYSQPIIMRCPVRARLTRKTTAAVESAHYVLVPDGGRDSFMLFDAPVDLEVPWLSGPEMDYRAIVARQGPHHDGFFYASGGQQGISFMLHGERVLTNR